MILDICTYIMARRDLVVTTSRGKGLNKIINDDTMEIPEYIPGGTYQQLTDLAIKRIQASPQINDFHVYLVGGLPNLTTRISNKKQLNGKPKWMRLKYCYDEVIHEGSAEEAAGRVIEEINKANFRIRAQGATPCFSTICPMSLRTWNHKRWRQRCTRYLKYSHLYQKMQEKHLLATEIVNRHIYATNKENQMVTPKIGEIVFKKRFRNSERPPYMAYGKFEDGVHGDEIFKLEAAAELHWTSIRNRHERRVGRLSKPPIDYVLIEVDLDVFDPAVLTRGVAWEFPTH